jgi:glutamyl-tRNA synthetase
VRKSGGAFALRIEDLDRERCKPAFQAQQLASLRAIGLDWDEGPEGGPFGPYLQSERLGLYEAALEKLRDAGLVYPCYCSRAEVARTVGAPHGASDDGPRYPGTCRALTEAGRREKGDAGRKPSWRFRVREGTIAYEDGVLGRVSQDVLAEVGDFVVRRADGVFAYQLAAVADDLAMRMTDVLRGADLAHSTPRQLLLYEALGAPPPRFHHVPILLGPDGEKLSKRHGPVGVGALLAAGVTASQLLAELARLSGFEPTAPRTAADLLSAFDLSKLPRGEQRWSPTQLVSVGGAD